MMPSPAEIIGLQTRYDRYRSVIGGPSADQSTSSSGTPGPTPGAGPGPHIIQLYKDPDTFDS